MDDSEATVRKLRRQQAALAGFGSFALRQSDLLKVLTEAAEVCAHCMDVPFSKVCRYRPDENDLLVEAGYGWKNGVIGNVVSRADASSPQGRAFSTGRPSICRDLRADGEFVLPGFYAEHGVISTVDVIIKGNGEPFGVLEIDNDHQSDYDQHDIDFLTGFANVIAEAVATSARTDLLRSTLAVMTTAVDEKDRLLDQKNVLAEELQHRVRNNLQLIYGMLYKQLYDTQDVDGRRGLKAIARRVSTLAQVYDHLLGSEMTRTTDFGAYVTSLCVSLGEIQATTGGSIALTCESETILIDLDAVTALGLIVTELAANSFDHAYPGGRGTIAVAVHEVPGDPETGILTVRDDGPGFTVDPEGRRHGLGLVRRLVEQLGGSVTVDFTPGTLWTIRFPIRSAAA
ncbi:GAF domain-containing protein [Siculibacillus lacustris]|uniref:histidine kinase n=1 Tax=Siculibacillus lacustris TaxID=1549641 RepID=A0A4Q9VKV4_9HYPH|nr:histidine kinase dimerization/phosphoacceptor domain -containing protein [Siculibacillus lacustris]TBW35818.1 GAF domain-containing protein [Siculibacillus lacustris]